MPLSADAERIITPHAADIVDLNCKRKLGWLVLGSHGWEVVAQCGRMPSWQVTEVGSDEDDNKDPNSDDGEENNNLIFYHNNQPVVGCIPGREGG